MARGIALALGVVVVGLLVVGAPWRAGASPSQENRIALLEERVADLESLATGWGPFDLTCASGEVAGEMAVTDTGGFYQVRVHWAPKTTPENVNNPLLNRGVGEATLQHCGLSVSVP